MGKKDDQDRKDSQSVSQSVSRSVSVSNAEHLSYRSLALFHAYTMTTVNIRMHTIDEHCIPEELG
jgi:hypothetical protein